MVEIFLVLSNLLFGFSILAYFYFKEVNNRKDDSERIEKLDFFYSQTITNITNLVEKQFLTLKEVSKSKDDLVQKTLLEYLKHNERLEKMILPQPVTKKAVQEILDQTPPMVPNDIDKIPEEIVQDELNEVLAKIPITKNTKIAFEGDMNGDLPEEMDQMSGKLS